MRGKSDARPSDLNGFLDSGSYLEGELRFDTSFRIDGKFHGKVTSEGDLMVGEGGEIEGELTIGRIFISGTIRGHLRATRRVQIAPSGKVFADIETPSLEIEDGALFEGRCSMVREGQSSVSGAAGAVGSSGAGGALPKLVAAVSAKPKP
ncbi:MAG TPA: polymer-forming cytoskeletal protein [Thermoanaerobaculia bacterium]|nr:polymer-forming cytoskeletal protein [Thermoanaerobaculia bacterium]